MPASMALGTSGKARCRFSLVTINARTRPSRICGMIEPRFWKLNGTFPASNAAVAGHALAAHPQGLHVLQVLLAQAALEQCGGQCGGGHTLKRQEGFGAHQ